MTCFQRLCNNPQLDFTAQELLTIQVFCSLSTQAEVLRHYKNQKVGFSSFKKFPSAAELLVRCFEQLFSEKKQYPQIHLPFLRDLVSVLARFSNWLLRLKPLERGSGISERVSTASGSDLFKNVLEQVATARCTDPFTDSRTAL